MPPDAASRRDQPSPPAAAMLRTLDTADAAARAADYATLARGLATRDAGAVAAVLRRVAGDPRLVETVRRHHLITLLWATMPEPELRACLPPSAFADFSDWLQRRRAAPAGHLRTVAEVQAALAAAGIACMVLKGVYLADRLYGGVDRRPQHDVDLLVRRRDFRGAMRVLRALGFTERWRDLHSATWVRDTANVDLHWCFRRTPAYRLDEDRIWREKIAYTIAATSFTTPSDADTLVALALSLFQDLGLGAAKLKQLLDVQLLVACIDRDFAWEPFFRGRAVDGTLAVVANVLAVVFQVFEGAATAPRLAAALAARRDLVAAPERAAALRLVFGERGGLAGRAWFFRVYPGSIARYWAWLLVRKLPAYVRGSAPRRAPTSMRPNLETLRVLVAARRAAPAGRSLG